MHKLLFASVAALAIATPATARSNSGYVGLEGGVLIPRNTHVDASVDFTDPLVPDIIDRRIATVKYKTGYDVDLIGGYDFGMFRLEAELGYKRATNKSLHIDDSFIADLNTGSGGAFTGGEFDLNGHTSVWSGMVNGLLDFGDDNGLGGFVGAGIGRANVKSLGDSDSAWAYQLLAGVRMAVSDNIDVRLKYRYCRTGGLNFNDSFTFPAGNGCVNPVCSGGTVDFDSNNHFSSHSLLASLIFNFGSPAAAPPPPPPPIMAPPPAPATQTCPDGSVILATDTCAAPPPPPPPPAPVERGERGQ